MRNVLQQYRFSAKNIIENHDFHWKCFIVVAIALFVTDEGQIYPNRIYNIIVFLTTGNFGFTFFHFNSRTEKNKNRHEFYWIRKPKSKEFIWRRCVYVRLCLRWKYFKSFFLSDEIKAHCESRLILQNIVKVAPETFSFRLPLIQTAKEVKCTWEWNEERGEKKKNQIQNHKMFIIAFIYDQRR